MRQGSRLITRATIVGAGGLGGPISYALARAHIELTIVDPDVVELSNLHRQIQFTAGDVGTAKATRLASSVVARGGTHVASSRGGPPHGPTRSVATSI